MEQPQGSTEVKRLYRSKVDRIFGGVCGGLAEYFHIDPTVVRVIWFVILFLTGFWAGLFFYLVCLVVMKDNPEQNFADKKPQSTGLYWGLGLVLLGFMLLANRWDWDWRYFRPFHFHIFSPWFFHWEVFWPVVLILFGIFYLVHVLRKKEGAKASPADSEPMPQAGKLFRSRSERIIGGVCGGLAKHLDIDPVFIRILWVIITVATKVFPGIVVYLLWMMVVPEQPIEQRQEAVTVPSPERPTRKTPRRVKKLPENKDEIAN